MQVVLYNKLSWFVFKLPKKDIATNAVVQCRQYFTIIYRCLRVKYFCKVQTQTTTYYCMEIFMVKVKDLEPNVQVFSTRVKVLNGSLYWVI